MMMMMMTYLRTTEIDIDDSADSRLKVERCTDDQIIFANVTHNSLVKYSLQCISLSSCCSHLPPAS